MADGDDETNDDVRNIQFEFKFNAFNIDSAMAKLPLEYETNMASFMEKVEASPPTSFDDLE